MIRLGWQAPGREAKAAGLLMRLRENGYLNVTSSRQLLELLRRADIEVTEPASVTPGAVAVQACPAGEEITGVAYTPALGAVPLHGDERCRHAGEPG